MTPSSPQGLGLVLPELPSGPESWRDLGALATEAETLGAASLWLTDHLFWHRPTVEVMTALALVAAATTTATIGPCVLQLPLRDPAVVAKSAGFLGALAPDRVVVGVGVGEHRGEYEAAGHGDRFGRRGALLDAGIDALRRSWAAEGTYAMDPGGPLPIWVGGRSDAARRRAATRGDGWIPHFCRLAGFDRHLSALAGDLERAGRDRSTFTSAAMVVVAVEGVADRHDDPARWLGALYALPPSTFDRVLVRGPAAAVAEEVAGFRAVGVDHVVVFPVGDDPVGQFAAVEAELAH